MNDVLAVLLALAVSMMGSELALRGTKLQTGLVRVVAVWAAVYAGLLVCLLIPGTAGALGCTIFWGGAFLSWFGVRSHIESSILMRMMFLLRKKPMTEEELVTDYESHYGETLRMEELRKGKLLRQQTEPAITSKGRFILRVVSFLR
jgi:hypothetical protein